MHGVQLTTAQHAALQHVESLARARGVEARERLHRILADSGCSLARWDLAARAIRDHARVAFHFHPDRLGRNGRTSAESLLLDGRYANQFETGTSTGSLTAFPGGARDEWERSLFGGAYHQRDLPVRERPTYGALELIRHPDGPWPRFGSCYLVLLPAVNSRTTFTFAGSEQALAIERAGTVDSMDSVWTALLAEVSSGEGSAVAWPPYRAPTLGVPGLTVDGLLDRVCHTLPQPREAPLRGRAGRTLDSGIEAQVHGDVDLRRDAELLVADPSFHDTATGAHLQSIARSFSVPLQWHCGFRLNVDDVPDDFRGPAMPALARRITANGWLDAATIGAAERSLHSHPEEWRDVGDPAATWQQLKQLWHVVVHFGQTATNKIDE